MVDLQCKIQLVTADYLRSLSRTLSTNIVYAERTGIKRWHDPLSNQQIDRDELNSIW